MSVHELRGGSPDPRKAASSQALRFRRVRGVDASGFFRRSKGKDDRSQSFWLPCRNAEPMADRNHSPDPHLAWRRVFRRSGHSRAHSARRGNGNPLYANRPKRPGNSRPLDRRSERSLDTCRPVRRRFKTLRHRLLQIVQALPHFDRAV